MKVDGCNRSKVDVEVKWKSEICFTFTSHMGLYDKNLFLKYGCSCIKGFSLFTWWCTTTRI